MGGFRTLGRTKTHHELHLEFMMSADNISIGSKVICFTLAAVRSAWPYIEELDSGVILVPNGSRNKVSLVVGYKSFQGLHLLAFFLKATLRSIHEDNAHSKSV